MPGFMLGQPTAYGRTQQVTVAAGINPGVSVPAAGAGFTFTCQPYDMWRLVFCRFTLTTSATVADRYVTVEYPDGTGTSVASDGAAVAVEASTTAQVFAGSLNRGNSEWNNASDVFFPLCGIWLEAGRTVRIAVANIDSTDQLGAIRLTFDRVPVDPLDYGYENERARVENAMREAGQT